MKRILYTLIAFSVALSCVSAFAQTEQEAVPGEYLIKFKHSSGAAIAQQKLLGKASMKAAFSGSGMYHIAMKSDASEALSISALKNDPDVEFIEPNYILYKSEVDTNGPVQAYSYDERVEDFAASTNPNIYGQSAANTRVAQAWQSVTPLGTLPTKTIVAVVDTGLDRYHPVFNTVANGGTGALWVNHAEANGLPGVDDDQNGFVDDVNGWNFIGNSNNFVDDDNHGTHVAGIVVGAGQNIFASTLAESKILVMPLKFLGGGGSGTTANAIRAIYYAVNNGARVINNSWGGASYSRALHDAITYAYDHQVLVVSAAGNYGDNNDAKAMYPAGYDVPSNLAIASTSNSDKLSNFSNFGATSVNLGAPGEYIESTLPGNSTGLMSGTSMASPLVAGLAALAFREAGGLSGYQIKQLILGTAARVDGLYGKVSSSSRVDALALVDGSKAMVTAMASQPTYKPDYLTDRSVASEAAGGGGGGCGLVKAVTQNGPGSGAGGGGSMVGVIVGLLLLPLIIVQALRSRDPKYRRRHDRFKMNSQISVNVGGRELVGAVNTISEGGLSFSADEALEKGGVVTMRIQSPDGKEVIEVQGQVVWSEANNAYGVQFENAKQGTLAMIRDWTAGLMKT